MGRLTARSGPPRGPADHAAGHLLPVRRAVRGRQAAAAGRTAAAIRRRRRARPGQPGRPRSARTRSASWRRTLGPAQPSTRSARSRQPRCTKWWPGRISYGAPLHAHVSEQVAENRACLAAYRATPAEVLSQAGALGPRSTAVHATHLTGSDIELLGGSRCHACFCPTTEADLADGIGPARALADAGSPLTLGSDSHAVIDLLEEARRVELGERLATQERGHFTAVELAAAATDSRARQPGLAGGGRTRARSARRLLHRRAGLAADRGRDGRHGAGVGHLRALPRPMSATSSSAAGTWWPTAGTSLSRTCRPRWPTRSAPCCTNGPGCWLRWAGAAGRVGLRQPGADARAGVAGLDCAGAVPVRLAGRLMPPVPPLRRFLCFLPPRSVLRRLALPELAGFTPAKSAPRISVTGPGVPICQARLGQRVLPGRERLERASSACTRRRPGPGPRSPPSWWRYGASLPTPTTSKPSLRSLAAVRAAKPGLPGAVHHAHLDLAGWLGGQVAVPDLARCGPSGTARRPAAGRPSGAGRSSGTRRCP